MKKKFKEISNRDYMTKPEGGLWASDEAAEYGWKLWNEDNKFAECKEKNSFRFELSSTANVLHIRSIEDLEELPKLEAFLSDSVCLDFEKLKASGIDAIELHFSEDWRLYWALYGWDCDSILIMNPDVVQEVTKC